MSTFPVIISFYTVDTPYQIEVQNLIASCAKYRLQTAIEGYPSFGTWELNCAFKPFFILQKMQQLQKPLLWVDADGVFLQKPTWQDAFQADLSVRMHDDLPTDHPSKVISSTIFVANTKKAEQLIRYWALETKRLLLDPERKEEFWDQIALRNVLLASAKTAKIAPLPFSYAKIFDHPGDMKSIPEAVIEHYQASRRFKKIV